MHLSGHFENFNNFDTNIKDKIIDIFSPPLKDINYLINKYPNIKDITTCSLHIRGGPDMRQIWNENVFESWKIRYHKSIDHMIEFKNIKTFIICTNDKEYSEIVIEKYKDKKINFIYSEERDFYDIWLISLIKNNIVSFSTLAWWGSYLNKNYDAYIVCDKDNRQGLHYPGWITL